MCLIIFYMEIYTMNKKNYLTKKHRCGPKYKLRKGAITNRGASTALPTLPFLLVFNVVFSSHTETPHLIICFFIDSSDFHILIITTFKKNILRINYYIQIYNYTNNNDLSFWTSKTPFLSFPFFSLFYMGKNFIRFICKK